MRQKHRVLMEVLSTPFMNIFINYSNISKKLILQGGRLGQARVVFPRGPNTSYLILAPSQPQLDFCTEPTTTKCWVRTRTPFVLNPTYIPAPKPTTTSYWFARNFQSSNNPTPTFCSLAARFTPHAYKTNSDTQNYQTIFLEIC